MSQIFKENLKFTSFVFMEKKVKKLKENGLQLMHYLVNLNHIIFYL